MTIPDSLQIVAIRAEAEPIEPLLVDLQAQVEASHSGLSDPHRVPVIAREQVDLASLAVRDLYELEEQLGNGPYSDTLYARAAKDVGALKTQLDQSKTRMNEAIPRLQEQLLRIERARTESTQAFSMGPSRGAFRRVTISVEANESSGSVTALRTGDVILFTEPSVSLRCQVSFGFSVMNPPPDYRAIDGVLVNDEHDELRTAANVLLHLSPKGAPLGLALGLGFGSGLPDLYLGGSIFIFDPVLLNAGAVWQRQQLLTDGLREGDAIVDAFDPDDLKRTYKASFFAGLSIVP